MNKALAMGLGLAALGGAVYLLYQRSRRDAPGGGVPGADMPTAPSAPIVAQVPAASSANNAAAAAINYNRTLKRGSTGDDVRLVQRAANDIMRDVLGRSTGMLVVNGKFGTATENVVKILSGKTSISYNQMKKLKRDMYQAKGLPDPYGSATAGVTNALFTAFQSIT